MRRFLITLLCLAPCVTQAQLESTSDLQRGLVGWWRFNEGTGTNAFDLSGNANTGALSGSTLPVWTNGVFGGALYMDGAHSFVSALNASSLNPSGAISIFAWIKTPSPHQNFAMIVTKGTNTQYELRFNSTLGLLDFIIKLGTVKEADSTSVLPTNQWCHVGATYSGSSIQTWLNGVADGSPVVATGSIASDANSPLYIGSRGGVSFFYPGFIDDVRIYSRALSATEVLNLYSQGGGRTP